MNTCCSKNCNQGRDCKVQKRNSTIISSVSWASAGVAAMLIIPQMIEDWAAKRAYDNRIRDACAQMRREVTRDNQGRLACVDAAPAWRMGKPIGGKQ